MWIASWIQSDKKIEMMLIELHLKTSAFIHRTRRHQWATTEMLILAVNACLCVYLKRQRLTGSLDEPWICVVSDNRNGQFPEVELKSTSDDVNIFIRVHWDVSLFSVYTQSKKETGDVCFTEEEVLFHKYGWGDKRKPSTMQDRGIFVMHSFVCSHMTLATTGQR